MRRSQERELLRNISKFLKWFNQLFELLGFDLDGDTISDPNKYTQEVRVLGRNDKGELGSFVYNLTHYIIIDKVKYGVGVIDGKLQYYNPEDGFHPILDTSGYVFKPKIPTEEETVTFIPAKNTTG